jgi:rhodanese-related sulfurtransferase
MRFISVALLGIAIATAAVGQTSAQPAEKAAAAALPAVKQTKSGLYMSPKEALDAKRAGGDKVLLIDVRTRAEAMFVGMPKMADALVPYVELPEFMNDWDEKRSVYAVQLNNDFMPELQRRMAQKGVTKESTIILLCRSGDRSARAADFLASQGFAKVYSVPEGFEGDPAKDGPQAGQRIINGWKNAGLEWTYKLDKAKMYFPK